MLRSSQPTAPKAYFILGAGVFFLLMLITFLVAAGGFVSEFTILYVIFISASVGFIIWGTVMLIQRKTSIRAGALGKTATCVVVEKRAVGRRYGGVDFYVTVMFVDQSSGESIEHDAIVSEDFYTDVKNGDKLECRVYGKSCYLDPEKAKHVVTVEEEF